MGKLCVCQTFVSKGYGSLYFLCFVFITYSRFSTKNRSETQKFDFLRNVRWDLNESVAVHPSVVGDCLKMFVGKNFKFLDCFYVCFKRFLLSVFPLFCFYYGQYILAIFVQNRSETQKFDFLRNVRWDFYEIRAVHPWVRGDIQCKFSSKSVR